jgi:hypothetical protein
MLKASDTPSLTMARRGERAKDASRKKERERRARVRVRTRDRVAGPLRRLKFQLRHGLHKFPIIVIRLVSLH